MSHDRGSSEVSSPDSWYDPDESHCSDTTPSPSSYRAPALDPKALSSKLALYEASKSLSLAAETLTAAAQAMSKAAASLAVASGSLTAESAYIKSRVSADRFGFEDASPVSGGWSPAWQQSSYVLSAKNVTVGDVQTAPSDSIAEAGSVPLADLQANQAPATEDGSLPANWETEHPLGFPRATPVYEPGPNSSRADASPPQTEYTPLALAGVDESIPTTVPPVDELTKHENGSAADQHADIIDVEVDSPQTDQPHALSTNLWINTNITDNEEVIDLTSPSEPELIHAEPASFDAAIQPKSHFRLTRAFDELPAVLTSLVERPVVAPPSFKSNRLKGAVTNFLNGPESVLLWPTHIPLPRIVTVASQPNIQIIHIGQVSATNSGTRFARALVVTTEKLVSTMTRKKKKNFTQEYPLNASNVNFNQPGDMSVLQPYRFALRASLAGDSLAPSLYKAFISHHRANNTRWSAPEIAKRANEFARDFLLRGESAMPGEMVGGRIKLKTAEVRRWKLEPAVQSGDLLVGV